jgi:hypothetical protein
MDDADFSRVEVRARQFEQNLSNMFRRSPHMRAERAIEGFTERLTSGDIPGAIETISTKMSGLGLIGGAAFGLIATGIVEANRQLAEFDKLIEESDALFKKMPVPGSKSEEFAKFFETQAQSFSKLKEPGLLGKLWAGLGSIGGDDTLEQRQKQLADERAGKLQQMAQALREEGDAVMKTVSAEQLGLKFESEKAAILNEQKNRYNEILALSASTAEKQKIINAETVNALEKQIALRKKLTEESPLKKIEEKSQMSLDEILAGPTIRRGGTQQLSIDQFWARQAKMEENLGLQAKARGDQPEAFRHLLQSEVFKGNIQMLSDKEKMPAEQLKNAINGASVFQQMIGELKAMNNKLSGMGFANR